MVFKEKTKYFAFKPVEICNVSVLTNNILYLEKYLIYSHS